MYKAILILHFIIFGTLGYSQEHTDTDLMLATFGNMSDVSCGDDDFSQLIFFAIPENFKGDFFFRVFDPDCGGLFDKSNGLWETNTIFEFYGGLGCISEFDARQTNPVGNYKAGEVLAKGIFASESEVDGKWVSFGPFNASQGESLKEQPGYVFFKAIIEGRTGNDGNMYSLIISKSSNSNIAVQKSSLFEYERTYMENNSILVSRISASTTGMNQISIPVKLEPIDSTPDYNIIAEPLDE